MFLIFCSLVTVHKRSWGWKLCVGGVCVIVRHLSILKAFISLTCNGIEEGCIKAFFLLTDAYFYLDLDRRKSHITDLVE